MEANNIFKRNFKSLKIDKNKSQNFAKQKKIKITLLFEFEVRSLHLPCSLRKFFLKIVKKTTKPRINYNFLYEKTEGSGFNRHGNGQKSLKLRVRTGICIICA